MEGFLILFWAPGTEPLFKKYNMVGNYKSTSGNQIEVNNLNGKYGFNLVKGEKAYGHFDVVSTSNNVFTLAGGLVVTRVDDNLIKLDDLGVFEDFYKNK